MRRLLTVFTLGIISLFAFVFVWVFIWVSYYLSFNNKLLDQKISLRKAPVLLLLSKYEGLTKGFLYQNGSLLSFKIPSKIILITQSSDVVYNLGRVRDNNGNLLTSSSGEFDSNNNLIINMNVSPKLKDIPDAERYLNTSLELTFFQMTHDIPDINQFGQTHDPIWEKLQKSNFLFYPLITIKQ